MTEVFVLLMCIGDWACSEALKSYRAYNPNVKKYERKARDLAYKYGTKEAMVVLGTYGTTITNKKVRLRLMHGVTLTGNQDEIVLGLRYEF